MTLSELCLRTTDIGKGWQLVEDFSMSNEGCNKQIRLKIQKKTTPEQTNKQTKKKLLYLQMQLPLGTFYLANAK